MSEEKADRMNPAVGPGCLRHLLVLSMTRQVITIALSLPVESIAANAQRHDEENAEVDDRHEKQGDADDACPAPHSDRLALSVQGCTRRSRLNRRPNCITSARRRRTNPARPWMG